MVADIPYRFKDVMKELDVSERDLLLLGCNGDLKFCVSLQGVSVVWFARYFNDWHGRYLKKKYIKKNTGIAKGINPSPARSYLEEPWHLEDVADGEKQLFNITDQCISSILYEGVAELQLTLPTNCASIFPDPPPDEIVSCLCPLGETRAAQLDEATKQYQRCNIDSLLVAAEELARYEKTKGHDVQLVLENDQSKTKSDGNYFQLEEDEVWRINFNGKKIAMEDVDQIAAIAQRLARPGERKVFLPTTTLDDDNNDREQSKGKTQGVNEVLSPESKEAIERKSKRFHRLLEEAHYAGKEDEAINLARRIDKLKNTLRTRYNATLMDSGDIRWGVLLEKNDVDKMKRSHHKLLLRGVEALGKRKNGKELAEHLKKHLLPQNFYSPPADFPRWEVTL